MLSSDYQKNLHDKRERAARFMGWTLAEMRRDRDATQELAAEYLAAGAISDASYLAVKLEDLRGAIAKRERAILPKTDNAGRDYQQLLTFARRLKADLPLERFIPAYLDIDLRQMGREWAGRCPLGHPSDSGLSFRVNPDKEVWKCWGCGNGGDLFVLVGLLNAEDRFFSQVRLVAGMIGLEGVA